MASPPLIRTVCSNVKSRKFQHLQCPYPATKGEFCCRHWKKPRPFDSTKAQVIATRSTSGMAKKIQRWWRFKRGLLLFQERSPAFFCRDLCHNDTEIATMGSILEIPRDYFFVMHDSGSNLYWGFDIRSLVIQYEINGVLENPYTKVTCSQSIYASFQKRVELLRKHKMPVHYEQLTGLSSEQSWNLRVLDVCLRLDMLGYRIATAWFSDLTLTEQHALYSRMYRLWNDELILTAGLQDRIVPDGNKVNMKLFKWHPNKIILKQELDSVRRTNLNVIERLISSAAAQSDRTLGSMYTVMSLCVVSQPSRRAYPWLI